jgi:hypothetical protein
MRPGTVYIEPAKVTYLRWFNINRLKKAHKIGNEGLLHLQQTLVPYFSHFPQSLHPLQMGLEPQVWQMAR